MKFAEQYEFVGINSAERIVENLRYIRQHLPKETTLAVMLGGELYYEKNTFPAYENRHLVHKEINAAIRAAAEELDIRLIDVNRYLVDQSSFMTILITISSRCTISWPGDHCAHQRADRGGASGRPLS